MYEMAEGGKSHGMASKRKNVNVELKIQWLVKNWRVITSSCHHVITLSRHPSQLCSGFEDSTTECIIHSQQKNSTCSTILPRILILFDVASCTAEGSAYCHGTFVGESLDANHCH